MVSYVSTGQLARACGVHRNTIGRWVKDRVISRPAIRCGQGHGWTLKAAERIVRERREAAGQDA